MRDSGLQQGRCGVDSMPEGWGSIYEKSGQGIGILGITGRYLSNRRAPEKTTKAGEKEAAINILNPKNTFNISALFPKSPLLPGLTHKEWVVWAGIKEEKSNTREGEEENRNDCASPPSPQAAPLKPTLVLGKRENVHLNAI